MKDSVEVHILTPNGHHLAFATIGDKTRHIAEEGKRRGKEINVLFDRGHEDGRVIGVKGGPNGRDSTP